MTYRDEPSTPSCPVCVTRDSVQRSSGPKPWLCGLCWSVFDGTTAEWEQMGKAREQWANQKQRAAENEGGRG